MSDAGTIPEALPLGGFAIRCPSAEAFAAELLDARARGERRRVFFANTNFVVKCAALRQRMQTASVRIVNDGIGMDLAALLLYRRRFPHNLNGTDFIPFLAARALASRASQPLRFFLLGGRPGVALRAASTLRERHGQQVVGVCDGYGEFDAARASLVDTINASHADVVLVAFGNPLQETWILDHDAALVAPLAFGVGALLDFLAGDAQRAPDWMRRLHLEWLFRLSREPRRLLRRYTLELAVFFWTCLRAGRRV